MAVQLMAGQLTAGQLARPVDNQNADSWNTRGSKDVSHHPTTAPTDAAAVQRARSPTSSDGPGAAPRQGSDQSLPGRSQVRRWHPGPPRTLPRACDPDD